MSEIEQEHLSGNIHLFQCLCANHENIILNTLVLFSNENNINIIDHIYNCLFTIHTDQDNNINNNYEKIKFTFSNKSLRQKSYSLLLSLIKIKASYKTDLTMHLLSHHKVFKNESSGSKIIDLDIPFRMKQDKFIGLTNYGATCYLNSLLQQLYMMPSFRFGVYSLYNAINKEENNDFNPLYQLQLLFANLSCS